MSARSQTPIVRRVRMPGDKSITHRALILAGLAHGRSQVREPLVALDTGSTAACMRALGVDVPPLDAGALSISGLGVHGLREPAAVLDCGNSGTTARHLLGLLAGCSFRSVLTGDESLRSRPMRRVTTPLAAAGAAFEEMERPDRLPIAVRGGRLHPIAHDAPRSSAQVKSALLLAAITGSTSAQITEPLLSRDHTERMLAAMGAPILVDVENGRPRVRLEPADRLDPLDITVPGDFSTAAFFIAFAHLAARALVIEGTGANPARTGFIDVLARMGARITLEARESGGGEPVADFHVERALLRGVEVAGEDIVRMIDEVPALAVLACRAEGETRITGASELRVKESDRIAALVGNLRAIGVEADELPDGLVVRGTPSPLRGRVTSHGDHRIAMAFGLLAVLPENDIRIDDPALAGVSDPGFWARLHGCLTGAP